jgi:hypothetical protein
MTLIARSIGGRSSEGRLIRGSETLIKILDFGVLLPLLKLKKSGRFGILIFWENPGAPETMDLS